MSTSIHKKKPLNEIIHFIFIFLQLLLLLWVVKAFHIEENFNTSQLISLVIGGFVIHSFLPKQWRLPFFILISLVAIFIFFDPLEASILIGIISLLLGICLSPIALNVKKITVLAIAVFLGLIQMKIIPLDIHTSVIAVVGGIFMFRGILYLYELKYEKTPASIWQRVSYFLLLPNIVFPLFPVVDYKTFLRTYYDQEETKIYTKGIQLMIRGVFHLMLYRLIYTYCIPSLTEVNNIYSLLQYIVFSYTLVLRLSGIFHFIIGILCLFGFNFPEVFNNYFLASGFEDYWRRINIYWKDFILKIFYYPIYFKVKKLGIVKATIISTLLVFLVNWVLHIYQWFWILGKASFRLTDILFWMIFGVLITVSGVIQLGKSKKKTTHSFKNSFIVSGKITATFMLIAFLWSLWISPTLHEWIRLLEFGASSSFLDYIVVLGGLGFVLIGGSFIHYFFNHESRKPQLDSTVYKLGYGFNILLLLALSIGGLPRTQIFVEENTGISMNPILKTQLSDDDEAADFEGYYEEVLTNKQDFSALVAKILKNKKGKDEEWVQFYYTKAIEFSDDILLRKLIPTTEITFKGAPFKTNRWGMRDKEYLKTPPKETKRFALVGASLEMGSGVNNEQVFEAIIEERLNTSMDGKFELLNFSVGGRNLIQHVYTLEEEVLDFHPDYLIIFSHDQEWNAMTRLISELTGRDNFIKKAHPFLNDLLKKASLQGPLKSWELKNGLKPFKKELIEWHYKEIVAICKQNDIKPIWVHIPNVKPTNVNPKYDLVRQIAQDVGFYCIGFPDLYSGMDTNDLRIAPNDNHPNVKGHQIIADTLYEELVNYLKQ